MNAAVFLPLSHSAVRPVCIAHICRHSLPPYSLRARADAVDRARKILDYLETRQYRKLLKARGGAWRLNTEAGRQAFQKFEKSGKRRLRSSKQDVRHYIPDTRFC